MELIKILLEQSTDYSNWNTVKPSDFSTSKYSTQTEIKNGRVVISYKLKETGGSALSDYVGKYKTDTTPSFTVETALPMVSHGVAGFLASAGERLSSPVAFDT
jgi:hypothetical protein